MHIAIHDALNAIDRKYQSYRYHRKADPGTSPDAAIAAAGHEVLVTLIGQLPPELVKKECIDACVANAEAAYKDATASIPDTPAKIQGIALGKAAAAAILALRANDHATAGTPGTPFIVFEDWEKVTPFVLRDSAHCLSPPYAVTDKNFKADLDEVKSMGGTRAGRG